MDKLIVSLAYGKTATASSVEAPQFSPSNAVDGDPCTYWSSKYQDNAWLAVGSGKRSRKFNRINIIWETAYAKAFSVQASSDGKTWTDIYKTTDGKGGTTEIKLPGTEARHIRVVCTKRGTQWGNAIREIVINNEEPKGKLYFSFISQAYYMDKPWGHGMPLAGIRTHGRGGPRQWRAGDMAGNLESAEEAKELFTQYHEKYGDDVALMPSGVRFRYATRGRRQGLVPIAEVFRDESVVQTESAAIKRSLPWAKLEIVGGSHRTNIMVRAAEDLGFKAIWGHCWEQTYHR